MKSMDESMLSLADKVNHPELRVKKYTKEQNMEMKAFLEDKLKDSPAQGKLFGVF